MVQPLRFVPAALAGLVLAACSGSTSESVSGGGQGGLQSVQLSFDTGAGTTAALDGQLQIVAFERADGSLTANVLSAPAPVALADPLAAPSGVVLHGIPRDVYTAVQLSFVPGSLRAQLGSGAVVPVRDVATPVRVALAEPMDLRHAPVDWLQLRHRDALQLSGSGTGPRVWRPQLDARLTDMLPVFGLWASVLSVDPARQTAAASVPAWGNGTATLVFRAASSLTLGGVQVPVAEFLQRIDGVELEVDALVQGAGRVWVLAAREKPSRTPAPGGNKSEVVGVITGLKSSPARFTMRVLRVVKAGTAITNQVPAALEVHADGMTKVKWLPRWGRTGGAQVGFGALRDGMMVDVSWHGAPASGAVTAQKVDITAGGRGRHNIAVGGQIASVSVAGSELVLEPRKGGVVTVGGKSYPSVVVELEPDAILVHHRRGGELELRSLAQVPAGDLGWVLGRPLGGNRLRATLVVTLTP